MNVVAGRKDPRGVDASRCWRELISGPARAHVEFTRPDPPGRRVRR